MNPTLKSPRQNMEKLPDLRGMSGMDAVSLLENLGLEVEVRGNGKVKKAIGFQGDRGKKVTKIILELS